MFELVFALRGTSGQQSERGMNRAAPLTGGQQAMQSSLATGRLAGFDQRQRQSATPFR